MQHSDALNPIEIIRESLRADDTVPAAVRDKQNLRGVDAWVSAGHLSALPLDELLKLRVHINDEISGRGGNGVAPPLDGKKRRQHEAGRLHAQLLALEWNGDRLSHTEIVRLIARLMRVSERTIERYLSNSDKTQRKRKVLSCT